MDRLPGRNAVIEALRSGRKIKEICISGTSGMEELASLAKKRGVPLRQVDREELDILMPEAPHQGVVAFVESYSYASLDEVFDRAAARGEAPLILPSTVSRTRKISVHSCAAPIVAGSME